MFVDKSAWIADNPAQLNYGVAVTDVDRDGQFELVVAGFGFRNLVLKWDGNKLVNIADPVLADGQRQAIGLAACDIDSDGYEEIYILNTDSFGGAKRYGDRLLDYADGEWVDLFSVPVNQHMANLVAGRSVACVDRRGDGQYGFVVANYGGPMRLYELDDDGFLRDVAPQIKLNVTTGGRTLLSLPLVSEHMDIFAGNELGPNYLFINQGDGTYRETAVLAGISDPYEHVRGAAVLDANGDGRFDLVYGNWEGPHRLFVQQSRGRFNNCSSEMMATPSRVRTVIAADFDNDGYEEIFFNNIGQPNRLFGWRNDQWTPLEIGAARETNGMGTGAAVSDVNGDGRLELLISHGESVFQPLTLYHMPENGYAWLRVLPLTAHGAPARGAVVKLIGEQRTQIRVIDAGSGYLCQMEPIAHFGLGQHPDVERVEVRWPDGIKITLDNPTVNQLLIIAHPGM